MRYLVTGATGFLGGHLASALLARGEEVVAMGRDREKCLALEQLGVKTIRCDLCDSGAVSEALLGAEVIIHAAALSAPWGLYRDFHAANVTATENVVHAAMRNGARRLVFVSSPSVTFDGSDQAEVDETQPYATRFLSPYQQTKKLAEDVVNQLRGQMEFVILRPKAIFGPGDNALLPRFISAARKGRLRQIGDGNNLVDLTYITNVVDAILLAAVSNRASGHTYILTNDEHVALWPLLRRVLAIAGCNSNLRTIPRSVAYGVAAWMETKARWTQVEPVMTKYAVAILARTQTYAIQAARSDLGYVPSISVENGVELMRPWLRTVSRQA
jgi:2-alkyl-3-oxoalkanoate reductase